MVTHVEPTDGVPLDEPPAPITLTKLEVQQNFINNTYNGLFDEAKSQISTVIIIISGVVQELELKMKVTKDHTKFYNQVEGPYLGLLLVESAY